MMEVITWTGSYVVRRDGLRASTYEDRHNYFYDGIGVDYGPLL